MGGWLGVVSAAHVRRGVASGFAQIHEGDFKPYRPSADYDTTARPVPLAELRDRLHLTSQPNWGYQLRRGLVPLDDHDIDVIREAMGA
jgi:hypothetical protein